MKSSEYKYLRFVRFKGLLQWDLKRYLNKTFNSKYDIVDLGTHIKEESNKYAISEPGKKYGILGVNNQTGIFDAYWEDGSRIKQKYKRMETGWIAYNPYRVNVGSIGIKKPEHKNEYISPAYVVFSCQPSLYPDYLFLTMKTPTFNKIIRDNTTGSVRQNLSFDTLTGLPIPTPTFPEQQALIKAYNERIKQAQELEEQSSLIEKKIEEYLLRELGIYTENKKNKAHSGYLQLVRFKNIEKWSIEKIYNHGKFFFDKSNYPITTIKALVKTIDGGKTPSTSKSEYWNGSIYWVSAKDMKELFLENIQDKITETAVLESGLKIHPEGSILCVFRSGILRHSFPICTTKYPVTINQDLKVLTIDEMTVSKMYFVYYLKFLQEMVLEASRKKGVTVESINMEEFLNIPIILPPQKKQIEIVNHIDLLLEQIKQLRHQAEDLRKKALEEFEKEIFE